MATTDDPIVDEVRKARRIISAFYNDSIQAIAEAAARGFDDFPKDARAKALGMTYGEYCLAEVEGRLPLCAGEEPTEYKAGN